MSSKGKGNMRVIALLAGVGVFWVGMMALWLYIVGQTSQGQLLWLAPKTDVVHWDAKRMQSALQSMEIEETRNNSNVWQVSKPGVLQALITSQEDPWGTHYRVVVGDILCRVQSAGPDRQFDTEDDIWEYICMTKQKQHRSISTQLRVE